MDELRRSPIEAQPQIIVAGWSAYPRQLDFARFREIADAVGAILLVDMAHFAGLVAAGEHPNPVPYADVVTTTIHKTLGGARGGMILCKEEYAKKINSAVFPGQQGGPLMHVIAGKAVALKIAQSELFRERQRRTRAGAAVVAEELLDVGVNVLTGGTDVHLVLADLRESALDGQQAEDRLHDIGITVNRNAVPIDPRPPMVSSGLRIGTPALATRGIDVDEFREIGKAIGDGADRADWNDAVEGRADRAHARAGRRVPAVPAARRPRRGGRAAAHGAAVLDLDQPLGHHLQASCARCRSARAARLRRRSRTSSRSSAGSTRTWAASAGKPAVTVQMCRSWTSRTPATAAIARPTSCTSMPTGAASMRTSNGSRDQAPGAEQDQHADRAGRRSPSA